MTDEKVQAPLESAPQEVSGEKTSLAVEMPDLTPFTAKMGEPLAEGVPHATKEEVVAAVSAVQDPELLLSVYELGLIYDIKMDEKGDVFITMTLTSPSCPMGGDMPYWVAAAVSSVPGVGCVEVSLTFDPPWSLDRLSDDVKIAMGLDV